MFNLVSFQSCSARPQVADSRCPIDLVAGHKLLRKAWQLTEVGAVFVTLSPCERPIMVIGSKKKLIISSLLIYSYVSSGSQRLLPLISHSLYLV